MHGLCVLSVYRMYALCISHVTLYAWSVCSLSVYRMYILCISRVFIVCSLSVYQQSTCSAQGIDTQDQPSTHGTHTNTPRMSSRPMLRIQQRRLMSSSTNLISRWLLISTRLMASRIVRHTPSIMACWMIYWITCLTVPSVSTQYAGSNILRSKLVSEPSEPYKISTGHSSE